MIPDLHPSGLETRVYRMNDGPVKSEESGVNGKDVQFPYPGLQCTDDGRDVKRLSFHRELTKRDLSKMN